MRRDCDALSDEAARLAVTDLFRLARPKMRDGGSLILFRPGTLAHPPWLLNTAGEFGWTCRHAVTWQRGAPKLGDGRAPYSTATERLLVFVIGDEPLVNHDGSGRSASARAHVTPTVAHRIKASEPPTGAETAARRRHGAGNSGVPVAVTYAPQSAFAFLNLPMATVMSCLRGRSGSLGAVA